MALELVTPLPPGAPSHTRLAKHGVRLVVLREIKDGTDCSWPQPSPNMVTLQEVGELQGKRHALFPWVPGVTLRELVKALDAAGRPVPLGLVGRVLVDSARALAVITPARAHGGIQDGAMQIGFDGQISVLDFGAPRVSRFRPIGRVNFAADVFALGGVLHTVLTGFEGDYASPPITLPSPSTSHSEATPALDDVVMRALSPQPDSRQADAQTFADELEAVLGDQLFARETLAEVVGALFKDRIKLLHSLGGLIEEQPSLEAVLPGPSAPLAPIPGGTQPGVGGPRMEPVLSGAEGPPSEPTLPRISLGEAPADRTDVRISIPPDEPVPSRSMVPWESGESFPGIVEPLTRPSSGPPLSGPRPSAPAARVESDTNPGVAEVATNPRASSPRPSDTDESSVPRPRPSTPRPLGAEDEHAATRAGGPRALSRTDVEAARPRASAPRPVEPEAVKTTATELPDDTNPRAQRPRSPRAVDAEPATVATELPEDTNPRVIPRSTSRVDAEAARPRPSAPRPADSDSDVAPRTVATELPDDTNPRAKAPPRDEEFEDTGPIPGNQPRPRNTTEAERHRALGQERLRTPPAGVAAASTGEVDDDEELRNEPTAVKARPDPRQTAQTNQTLVPAPAAAKAASGGGLRVVIFVLLVLVLGIAGAVLLKLKRQSEEPLPIDETALEVDAGAEEPVDAGQPAPPDAGSVALVPELDGGEEEEEEDEADAGEPVDAGAPAAVDAGVPDAGVKVVKKAPVKRKRPVKKKKRR